MPSGISDLFPSSLEFIIVLLNIDDTHDELASPLLMEQ